MDTNPSFLKYLIALTFVPGIGSITARQLIAVLGSPEAIFKEKISNLQKVQGMGPLLASNIQKSDFLARAEETLLFAEKYKIRIYAFTDQDYPNRLKQCEDAPLVFFQKGHGNLDRPVHISMVGTRKSSAYGRHYCDSIVAQIKEHGIDAVIISGLAYGIDACAHKAALDHGLETWAVLAHGLDQIYPTQHTHLAKSILERGNLITEFAQGVYPAPSNFISRNRIIAGLSDVTIVVESAQKGGSLVTADLAFGYNREVMAIPGRIGDTKSEGCNYLIKSNKASMLENYDDLAKLMAWDQKNRISKSAQLRLFEQLDAEQKALCDWLKENNDSSIDKIMKNSGIDKHKIPAILLDLEFMNLVKPMPGKVFRLI